MIMYDDWKCLVKMIMVEKHQLFFGEGLPLIYNYGYLNSVKSTEEIKEKKIIKNKR